MKATLAVAGFIVGFVWVLTAMFYALVMLGVFEMVGILLTAAFVGAMGAGVGFAVGCVVDGVRKKSDGTGLDELNDATGEDEPSEG